MSENISNSPTKDVFHILRIQIQSCRRFIAAKVGRKAPDIYMNKIGVPKTLLEKTSVSINLVTLYKKYNAAYAEGILDALEICINLQKDSTTKFSLSLASKALAEKYNEVTGDDTNLIQLYDEGGM